MQYIRQNATHKVVIGPAVDVGDGFTPETGVLLSTADEAEAILHDNATVVSISAYTWAAITTADGYYHLTLQSGISGTVGHLTIVVQDDSVCLPMKADFTIVEEAVYDALFAASADIHTAAISNIESSLVIVKSDLVIVVSDTTAIHSDTTIIASDVILIYSDTTAIEAAGGGLSVAQDSKLTKVTSDVVIVGSDVVQIYSDTTIIASDIVVIDNAVSDIESSLVIVKSDLVLIYSDTTAIEAAGGGNGGFAAAPHLYTIAKAATSQIITLSCLDSSSAVGAKLAGLVFGSVGLTCHYNRVGAAGSATVITLASATKGTWVSSGFIAVDATNQPGDYELHLPDAVVATGVDRVVVTLKGASNLVPVEVVIELVNEIDLGSDNRVLISTEDTPTSNIESSLVIIKSDLVIIYSDTTAIEAAGGSLSVAQDSKLTKVTSDVIIIGSDLILVYSDTTAIHSDTTIIASDLVVVDAAISDVESSLVIVKSDLVIVVSDTTAIELNTNNLSVGAGGISVTAVSVTVTTGFETLTYTATQELDGTTHDIAPSVGNTEFYYEFSVGVTGVATEIIWNGHAESNGDSYTVKGYDWTSASFKTIGTITATNNTAIVEQLFIMTAPMTGFGANAGTVRWQITSADGANFSTDWILAEYTSLPEAGLILHSGVAQSSTSNTITLDAGANANNDFYNHARIVISSGTGSEQERIIVDYVGSTKVATIAPPWVANPDNTSAFEVEPALTHAETGWATIKVGLAAAATSTTITLDSSASASDDFYNGDLAHIDSGTGEGQTRYISDYNGTTKVATIDPAWTTTPDTTSEYIIEEGHPYLNGNIYSDTTAIEAAGGSLSVAQDSKLTKVTSDVVIIGSDLVLVYSDTTVIASDVVVLNAAISDVESSLVIVKSDLVELTAVIPAGITKNAGLNNYQFPMVLTSDHYTAATGLSVTGEMSIDAAAFVSVNGTITEISDGMYQVDLTAADTNGDTITYKFSAATADDTVVTHITNS